jgi:hypothetical protein
MPVLSNANAYARALLASCTGTFEQILLLVRFSGGIASPQESCFSHIVPRIRDAMCASIR